MDKCHDKCHNKEVQLVRNINRQFSALSFFCFSYCWKYTLRKKVPLCKGFYMEPKKGYSKGSPTGTTESPILDICPMHCSTFWGSCEIDFIDLDCLVSLLHY